MVSIVNVEIGLVARIVGQGGELDQITLFLV